MKAHNLKVGHVLVDPDGHLYEVISVHSGGDEKIYSWLWPDSSPVPNYFQTFEPNEDIVSINSSTEDTAVIPRVEEAHDGTVPDGTAE